MTPINCRYISNCVTARVKPCLKLCPCLWYRVGVIKPRFSLLSMSLWQRLTGAAVLAVLLGALALAAVQ